MATMANASAVWKFQTSVQVKLVELGKWMNLLNKTTTSRLFSLLFRCFSGLCTAGLSRTTHVPPFIEPYLSCKTFTSTVTLLLSVCALTGFHGGCQVSRAVHLLSLGVRPSLSGSAPLPGVRGDPDRWKRSAPFILGANCCASQNVILATSPG